MGPHRSKDGRELGLMQATSPEREYFAHLAQGRFMLQRSRTSGAFFFYPRVAEPGTGATDLEWVAPSGLGTIYSSTLVRQRPPATDYNVVLVDLDEGPRMMSRVEGASAVAIGLRVRARVIDEEGTPVVVFVVEEPSAGKP